MNDPFEYSAPLVVDKDRALEHFEHYCRNILKMEDPEIANEITSVDQADVDAIIKTIGKAKETSGIVCLSSNPISNRMWGYYASSHKGICISYDTDLHPFNLAFEVIYKDSNEPLEVIEALQKDPTKFCDHIARRKGKEWDFEQEYRIPIGPIPETHTRLLPIDPKSIVEVRLGVKIENDFKKSIMDAISILPQHPKAIQMSCDYEKFKLIETTIEI